MKVYKLCLTKDGILVKKQKLQKNKNHGTGTHNIMHNVKNSERSREYLSLQTNALAKLRERN